MSDRPLGDQVDHELRRWITDVATVPGPAPDLGELRSPVLVLEGERTMSQGIKWGLIGAAAAAIAIIIGIIVFLGGDDQSLETIDPPDQSTSTTTVEPDPVPERSDPPPFLADATPLTEQFTPLGSGSYRVDAVATSFSLTLEQPLTVQWNSGGQFVLSDNLSSGPGDQDMVFLRPVALVDPANVFSAVRNEETGVPIADFEQWLDTAPGEIVVSERETTFLGEFVATRVDLTLGDTDCRIGEDECVRFTTTGQGIHGFLNEGRPTRVWLADIDDGAPLMVIASVLNDGQTGWFNVAEGVLQTLAFE